MAEQIIRIEIRGEGLGNPRDAADLADLAYGIDDGQVDGSVTFLTGEGYPYHEDGDDFPGDGDGNDFHGCHGGG
jgi:hypothetical protein